MAWLTIKEGDQAHAAVDLSTVKTVTKHWTGTRSELCLGAGCPHCLSGIPHRSRYQAKVIVDSSPLDWEFGEQVMNQLSTIPHDTNWANIIITRLGTSRNTRYQIAPAVQPQPAPSYQEKAEILTSDFLRRRYGNSFNDDSEG